jgi:hypothetical protein
MTLVTLTACREQLLAIGRKPGLHQLPADADVSVFKCVQVAGYQQHLLGATSRAAAAGTVPAGGVTPSTSLCCRDLDELTFYDAGLKPDWAKDKPPGHAGRLEFLRPGKQPAPME